VKYGDGGKYPHTLSISEFIVARRDYPTQYLGIRVVTQVSPESIARTTECQCSEPSLTLHERDHNRNEIIMQAVGECSWQIPYLVFLSLIHIPGVLSRNHVSFWFSPNYCKLYRYPFEARSVPVRVESLLQYKMTLRLRSPMNATNTIDTGNGTSHQEAMEEL
jgi:hypothetical protein